MLATQVKDGSAGAREGNLSDLLAKVQVPEANGISRGGCGQPALCVDVQCPRAGALGRGWGQCAELATAGDFPDADFCAYILVVVVQAAIVATEVTAVAGHAEELLAAARIPQPRRHIPA